MPADARVPPNVKQAVPFFHVTDIEASLRFYLDGLGFVMTLQWAPEDPWSPRDTPYRWQWALG